MCNQLSQQNNSCNFYVSKRLIFIIRLKTALACFYIALHNWPYQFYTGQPNTD